MPRSHSEILRRVLSKSIHLCMYLSVFAYICEEIILCIHLPTDLQPPNINSTNVIIIDEGGDLTLSCNHLNSNPVEQFYWRTANGSIINGTVNLALMLQFTDILRSSSGHYTCTVQDDRDNTASSTVTIVVQCKSV